WIALELRTQLLRAGRTAPRRSSSCNYTKFSTDAHRPAEHLARTDTELFKRLAPFEQFGERPLVRRKINAQLRAVKLPPAALFHQFAQEFLLRLNSRLDFRNLLL